MGSSREPLVGRARRPDSQTNEPPGSAFKTNTVQMAPGPLYLAPLCGD